MIPRQATASQRLQPISPAVCSVAASLILLATPAPSLASNDLLLRSLNQYQASRSSSDAGPSRRTNLADLEGATQYQRYKDEGFSKRPQASYNAGFVPLDAPPLPGSAAPSPSTSSTTVPVPRPSIKEQVKESQRLRELAEGAEREGNYQLAVQYYSEILTACPDLFVLSLEVRFQRALLLFEAIPDVAALRNAGEDSSASAILTELSTLNDLNRGDPDVMVAYASILYAEKPSRLAQCEELYEKATALNPSWNVIASKKKGGVDAYTYLKSKGWPPKTTAVVEKFLRLD